MKKVRAFTLLEMMIALILTGIIISIAYFSVEIISKQINKFKSENNLLMQSSAFHSVFENDFTMALPAVANGDDLVFFFPGNKQVLYTFNSSFIVRKVNTVRDTFLVAPFGIKRQFLNLEQVKANELIDEVSFHSKIAGEPELFHFKKYYSSADLMEAERNQNEGL